MIKEFSKRFKKLRENQEISQAKFALILNVSQQTINKWEHGGSEPTYEMLVRIATYFSVTTDYLLGLTNDPNPPRKGKGNDF